MLIFIFIFVIQTFVFQQVENDGANKICENNYNGSYSLLKFAIVRLNFKRMSGTLTLCTYCIASSPQVSILFHWRLGKSKF